MSSIEKATFDALRAAGHERAGSIAAACPPELRVSVLQAAGETEAASLMEAFAAAAAAGPPAIGSGVAPEGVEPQPAPTGMGGPLTMDDVKNMTESQINDRWDEVQAVMAGKS